MDVSSLSFASGTRSSLSWHFAWHPCPWDGPRPTRLYFPWCLVNAGGSRAGRGVARSGSASVSRVPEASGASKVLHGVAQCEAARRVSGRNSFGPVFRTRWGSSFRPRFGRGRPVITFTPRVSLLATPDGMSLMLLVSQNVPWKKNLPEMEMVRRPNTKH